MAYACTTCGAVADASNQLCTPCDNETESCSVCGTPEVDKLHVCTDKIGAMHYVCGGCGRKAVEGENLCNPEPLTN